MAIFGLWLCTAAISQAHRDEKEKRRRQIEFNTNKDDFVTRLVCTRPRGFIFSIFFGVIGIFFMEEPNNPFIETVSAKHGRPHQFLFGGFLLVSITIMLERRGNLPRTSCAWMLAFANWVASDMWWRHAMMQEGSMSVFHQIISNVCLVGALVSAAMGWLMLIKHEYLFVLCIAVTYMFMLHGLMIMSVAFWVDDPVWKVPCVFGGIVYASLAGLTAYWNYLPSESSGYGQTDTDSYTSNDITEKESFTLTASIEDPVMVNGMP